MTYPPHQLYRRADPSEPRPELDAPHVKTRREKVILSVVLLVATVAVAAVAFIPVDRYLDVSDDARDGREAIAAFLENPRHTEDDVFSRCNDLADGKYDHFGRDKRHFMFGCSGRWIPPAVGA